MIESVLFNVCLQFMVMIPHPMIIVIINCKQIFNKQIKIKQEENSKSSVLLCIEIFRMQTYLYSLNCIMFLTLSLYLHEPKTLRSRRRLNILYGNYLQMIFQLFH